MKMMMDRHAAGEMMWVRRVWRFAANEREWIESHSVFKFPNRCSPKLASLKRKKDEDVFPNSYNIFSIALFSEKDSHKITNMKNRIQKEYNVSRIPSVLGLRAKFRCKKSNISYLGKPQWRIMLKAMSKTWFLSIESSGQWS